MVMVFPARASVYKPTHHPKVVLHRSAQPRFQNSCYSVPTRGTLYVMLLTSHQLEKLSDICADIGQVSLASVFVPYFLDTPQPSLALLGLAVSLVFWLFSLIAINRIP